MTRDPIRARSFLSGPDGEKMEVCVKSRHELQIVGVMQQGPTRLQSSGQSGWSLVSMR